MRRALIICVGLIAVIAIFIAGAGAGGDDGTYEVRAIFGNAAFLVPGEEVRVAGAKVGTVSDIDITNDTEVAREDGSADPGKAVVVLKITDAGFQDFRTDASCLIRPQSLIGEKFVECQPTEPRAPGTEAPPELNTIEAGQPGAGQRLLPIDRNGTAVDIDLVNNIMREPYPDRFRLILNSLGASFAARGQDIAELVQNSNPALRETNEVLGVLAGQNETLAKLASDSDAVISALARKRENIADFINSSNTVAAATAERGADLEKSFAEFPHFLVELRSTMNRLDAFSQQATPVFTDLGEAAPALTRATKALGPFSDAGVTALTSLGKAADTAGPDLVGSDPVIRQIRSVAKSGAPGAKSLAKLLDSLGSTNAYSYLKDFIFNSGGAINPFDSRGHFLRAYLPLNNCVDYEIAPEGNCGGFFDVTVSDTEASKARTRAALEKSLRILRRAAGQSPDSGPGGNHGGGNGGAGAPDDTSGDGETTTPDEPDVEVDPGLTTPTTPTPPTGDEPDIEITPGPGETTTTTTTPTTPTTPDAGADTDTQTQTQSSPAERMRAARQLLEFLIGSDHPHKAKAGKR